MKAKAVILFVVTFFFCLNTRAQDLHTKKCKTKAEWGKYKRSEIAPWSRQPTRFSGNVLIRPKNVNRDFLIQLAKRLKSEYCNADYLRVAIFDDANLMDFGWEIYNKSKDGTPRARGFYTFDEKSGIDEIEILSKPGNPTELKIDLTKLINEKIK